MKTYSQHNCFQDVFALFVNMNKPGFVLDIGCKDPTDGNNSLLLLENGWSGLGIDINDYTTQWEHYSKSYTFLQADATDKEMLAEAYNNLPNVIDFLSLDVDENSVKALECLDFNKLKFRCICIEHDYYIREESLRTPQRILLEKNGYTRVIQTAAEDWYVNYELIETDVKTILEKIPLHHELIDNEMPVILEWLNIK